MSVSAALVAALVTVTAAALAAAPLLGAFTRDISTSAGASDEPPRDAAASSTASPAPLIKVGDAIVWDVFEHEQLLGMHRAKLLETLASSKVFGHKLKHVDLSGCSVFIFKLPSGQDEPTAADEPPASATDKPAVKATALKFVELKGAKTVGALAADDKGRLSRAGKAQLARTLEAFQNRNVFLRKGVTYLIHSHFSYMAVGIRGRAQIVFKTPEAAAIRPQ